MRRAHDVTRHVLLHDVHMHAIVVTAPGSPPARVGAVD
jgi:hypothetical protein